MNKKDKKARKKHVDEVFDKFEQGTAEEFLGDMTAAHMLAEMAKRIPIDKSKLCDLSTPGVVNELAKLIMENDCPQYPCPKCGSLWYDKESSMKCCEDKDMTVMSKITEEDVETIKKSLHGSIGYYSRCKDEVLGHELVETAEIDAHIKMIHEVLIKLEKKW